MPLVQILTFYCLNCILLRASGLRSAGKAEALEFLTSPFARDRTTKGGFVGHFSSWSYVDSVCVSVSRGLALIDALVLLCRGSKLLAALFYTFCQIQSNGTCPECFPGLTVLHAPYIGRRCAFENLSFEGLHWRRSIWQNSQLCDVARRGDGDGLR